MAGATAEMFASRRIASTRGVDDARRLLSEVFLPLEFPSSTTSTVVDLRLNALKVGRVTCAHMRFRDSVRIETSEAENFHVDIPTHSRATMRAGAGSPVYGTQNTAGIFMPGRPVEIDSGDDFAQISLMFPRDQLQLELGDMLGREPARPLELSGELDLTTPGAQTMMQALRTIDEASGQDHGMLAHPLSAHRLEQLLIQSLLFAQPHNYSTDLAIPAPTAGTRPVARAVELLRSDPAHPWTATELAVAVSLSVRSLQEGFRRALDTTPMAYLRQVRLERVHAELASAAPDAASVTEVAMRWGFVHLGRFAEFYRRAYSERPSDTARAHAFAV